MAEHARWYAAIAIVLAGCSLFLVDVPAHAVQTPEEENVFDAIALPNPQLLPDVVDIGAVNAAIEALLPDIVDEWPTLGVGGCSLSADPVTVSPDGFRVQSAATLQCSQAQHATKLVLCIQRRVADRWETMEESCRGAASVGQGATRKRTSGVCATGTWLYRVYAAASSVGTSPQLHARPGPASSLRCRTFGL